MARRVMVPAGLVAVVVAAVVWLWLVPGGEGARPHIVMIVIDTLRADRLGCYGHRREVSPELDSMARRGVRFAHTVAQCSWTRPSAGSFLTSLYPRTLGIHFEDRGDLPESVTTLAEVLRDSGYRTIGATANPHLNPSFNFHQGFDVYLDSINVFDWMPATLGQVPQAHPPLSSAREIFRNVLTVLDREDPAGRHSPHYLQLVVMEVHETWGENDLVRTEFKGLYPDVTYEKERRYLQAVRQVSRDIDWFVGELERRSGWDDFLVVLVSDHGEGLSSHPDVPGGEVHGFLLYESQLMVPWIMFSTGDLLPASRVVDRPVRLLDLMPTLLDLVDLDPPPGIRGLSLVPLIHGDGVGLPEHFIVETHFRGAFKMGAYSSEWRLFLNRDDYPNVNPVELQRAGVAENGVLTDLAEDHADIVRLLAREIDRWEVANPPAEPVDEGEELSPEMIEQLRSLGYLE